METVPNVMMLVGNVSRSKLVRTVCTVKLKFKTHAFRPFKVATCTFQILHAKCATLTIISMKMVNVPEKPIPMLKSFHVTKIIFFNMVFSVVYVHRQVNMRIAKNATKDIVSHVIKVFLLRLFGSKTM